MLADEKKSRCYSILLYTDTETYNYVEAINYLTEYFDEYAYILHDKDKKEDGSIKKEHIHFIGRFKNPRSHSSVLSQLCVIPSNHIEAINKWYDSVQYLIHYKNKDKVKYDVQDIVSNFDVIQYFKSDYNDENDNASDIIQHIYEMQKNNDYSIKSLVKWCIDNNCWSTLRRAQYIFISCLKEG